MNNRSNFKKKIIIAIGIIFIILIILLIILLYANQEDSEQDNTATLYTNEIEESNNEEILSDLYDMTEQERITYYCAEFFKLVDNRNYEKAYEILYSEYKENYFPTETSFSTYMQQYFPEDFSLNYTNFERLGDIYVLWVDVNDTLNGSYGHNFSMNVVIQENDYDDYVLSFSRNSAVEEEE